MAIRCPPGERLKNISGVLFMFNWVLTRIGEFLSWLFDWLWLLGRSGSWPESDPLVPVVIVFSILFGSACLAATVAELRNRMLIPHFCLGFALPVAYPVFAIFGLKKKMTISSEDREVDVMEEASAAMNMQMDIMMQKRELKARGIDPEAATFDDFEALRLEKEAAAEAAVAEEAIQEEAKAVGNTGINRAFFESIAVDSSGNRLGPYLIIMKDGSELAVNSIPGVFDELASCEVSGRDGKNRTIRIRYDMIAEVRNLS